MLDYVWKYNPIYGMLFSLFRHLSRVQLICDPMDYRPPGSSVHGISQSRILELVVISFSRGSS